MFTETRGKRDREKDTREEREYEQDQSSSRDHRMTENLEMGGSGEIPEMRETEGN